MIVPYITSGACELNGYSNPNCIQAMEAIGSNFIISYLLPAVTTGAEIIG